jgi:hypothetical protein
MTQNIAVWLVLVAALLGANLPFLSQRVLLVGPRQQDKAFGWRLLELVLLWLAVLGAGFGWRASWVSARRRAGSSSRPWAACS